ncbi:RHS repeat-associated core domain-containing protein, partial [Streptomyces sp. NPDC008121]|uniref:RHS repeat-associated core domain-containing protein n=1 Tax=Streptomyces sp. NPDC008121 TaxID=3364809 RepID=UPI0036F10CF5
AAFADGTEQTDSTAAYDSLGRLSRSQSQDVATEPAYGRGGQLEASTATPQNSAFPGGTITARGTFDLTGASVVKTLAPGQDPENNSRPGTTLVRDSAGRAVEERRPDGRKTTFTYTPSGQVASSVSPSGITTAYTYDQHTGRVTGVSVTPADGRQTEKTSYTYDPYTGALTAVFNPDDETGTKISYTYDADGNTTEVAYPGGKTIRREFGSHGQLDALTDTAGLTTLYTYNPDGTLAQAVQRTGRDETSEVKAQVSYTYDGLGRISRIARANGAVTDITFTGASQIKTEKTTRDGALLTAASYTYDSHGNLTSRTDERPRPAAGGRTEEADTTTTHYTYDAYGRLTGSSVSDGHGTKLSDTAYELNVSGDVISRASTRYTSGEPPARTITRNHIDSSGRLTTVETDGKKHSQQWDDEGNLLADHQGNRYTYNAFNQPASLTTADGRTTHYTYWADGSRATTQDSAPAGNRSATRFYYTPDGTLINDVHTTGDLEAPRETAASYLLAGTRQARTLTGDSAEQAAADGSGYLLQDRHGSTTALASQQGTITAAWNYTDYGQAAGHTGQPLPSPAAQPAGAARQPFTFAGEYTDPGGTQYLKARTVDPATGRFTTADKAPVHNRYLAYGANPVTRTDPSGHTDIPDWGTYLIAGAALAVAIITTALTAVAAGPASFAFAAALAGAVLDGASALLDVAARATGRNQLEDPLVIASLVTGAAGAALGLGSAFTSAGDYTRIGRGAITSDFAGTGAIPWTLSPAGKQVQLTDLWQAAQQGRKWRPAGAHTITHKAAYGTAAWNYQQPPRAAAWMKRNVQTKWTEFDPADQHHQMIFKAHWEIGKLNQALQTANTELSSAELLDQLVPLKKTLTDGIMYWQQVGKAHTRMLNAANRPLHKSDDPYLLRLYYTSRGNHHEMATTTKLSLGGTDEVPDPFIPAGRELLMTDQLFSPVETGWG